MGSDSVSVTGFATQSPRPALAAFHRRPLRDTRGGADAGLWIRETGDGRRERYQSRQSLNSDTWCSTHQRYYRAHMKMGCRIVRPVAARSTRTVCATTYSRAGGVSTCLNAALKKQRPCISTGPERHHTGLQSPMCSGPLAGDFCPMSQTCLDRAGTVQSWGCIARVSSPYRPRPALTQSRIPLISMSVTCLMSYSRTPFAFLPIKGRKRRSNETV